MKVIFSKDTSSMWIGEWQFNAAFLKCTERRYNDKLKIAGVVVLTDILRDLGFNEDIVAEGLRKVWIDSTDGDNDGFIDFGLNSEANKKFLKGEQDYAELEFNTVDI